MALHALFVGASGHIGAAVLQALKGAFPNLPITALVRSKEDIEHLRESYGDSVSIAQGSLEDLDLLEAEAAKSQIVINCAPDVPYTLGIAALLRGLATSPSPVFYIHTSGAARIWDPPNGDVEGRTWDDIEDFDALPTTATHARTDIQVGSASSGSVYTAIVSPTFVIGRTPSRSHNPPITFPDLMHVVKHVGGPFTVTSGRNVTGFIDTENLADIYVRLARNAIEHIVAGESSVPDEKIWGPRAYYFGSALEISFREFNERYLVPSLRRAGAETLLKNGSAQLTIEKVVEIIMGRHDGGLAAELWTRHIAEGFGTAMRVRGTRAKKYLGFEPVEALPGLDDAVRAVLREI
ncbi:hypothetical protein B0H67DRAFT_567978 [Lasiosphaeris hirsuta]|uniref:NAD(P)-binding domain-containing protein n=1 Tax=Lasiosphaeris hirsuta TaxID=260670 RepID=A0AA40AYS8_9PEZI|nr:hypothetical protein B0H67DRAFT_567978 [Lasiosphaeris hirsuta]